VVAPTATATAVPPAPFLERRGRYALEVPTGTICVEDDGRVWTIRDGKAESSGHAADCGGYINAVAFWTRLRAALLEQNFDELGHLVSFPLRVNTNTATFHVQSVDDLRSRFARVFPKGSMTRIRGLDPHIVWCNWRGGQASRGYLWASLRDAELRLYAVNRDLYLDPLLADEWPNPSGRVRRGSVAACQDPSEGR